MFKRTMTAAALAVALAAPAFAQQQPMNNTAAPHASQAAQKPGFVQNQQATEWRASKLIGASVYGTDNASIGEINDVIVGSDGKIKAAVVGVGGFVGVGEKDVALPFEALNVTRKPNAATIDKITVSYTKDELKNAPKFAYYAPGNGATTGAATGTGVGGSTSNPSTAPSPAPSGTMKR